MEALMPEQTYLAPSLFVFFGEMLDIEMAQADTGKLTRSPEIANT